MSVSETKKRVVILISGSGSNMVNLVEHCQQGKAAADVVAVISNQPAAAGLNKAAALGIDTAVLSHREFDTREAYDRELTALVASYQPDLVILAGFMRILTTEFVHAFEGRLLNIHPSLLPKYKGIHTHQRALDAGDTEHGVSVHFVTEELDGGPVILQAKVPIFDGDDADDLQARVHEQEYRIYPLVMRWFCAERLTLNADGVYLDGEKLGPQGYAVE
ncbi:phosphoribosylglycinamide formyltransferase [Aliidiomarina maris]|uniref:Phosphoribosylglycinamide formyltransferase n=1 Tax=Aliidiomarina maris TaxID=531312 RepID=A0A327X6Z2_9GAMM|nr:phosphoribosylglycinamide formyltransferase [Aliidiomarina maris]RAK01663.1 formyltetrahydrofolate-dependent phosphoribosylglycinamide formyltransferase [Aliidiomarina maris]RUO28485.1 phosphoribosylglycinamide formyltransferase [Aliidiomarina maris]